MQEQSTLEGVLERVVYRSEESGFSVLVIKIKSSSDPITVTGNFPEFHDGEQIFFKGSWSVHPKFGRQFKAIHSESKLPATAQGIKKYLGSGLIKGIGPKFAKRLVDHFKDVTLDIIDQKPDRLSEIEGIGKKRIEFITNAWSAQKEVSNIMLFLHQNDVSTGLAVKIYKRYKDKSITLIKENPYRLSEDIWGVGFKSADKIALKLGLEKNSVERIRSGILHVISEIVSEGHIYIELEDLIKNVSSLLELDGAENVIRIKNVLRILYKESRIVLVKRDNGNYITLKQYYSAEFGISELISKLQKYKSLKSCFNFDEVYKFVRSVSSGICLNEHQQRGVMSCLQNKISIITGGPGTGKTTLLKKLVEVLGKNNIRFKLSAPTGRASKRMFESTGVNTETLHRLLEFSPATMRFAKDETNALDLDFLIVDESSMIDTFLMHSLLKAVPIKAHVVFIGDVNQLPSVGAGNVLRDFIDSGKIPYIELNEIFRQAENSLIIVNAHKVNKGEFPKFTVSSGFKKDFVYIKEDEAGNVTNILKRIYNFTLPEHQISTEGSIVLTPMNKGVAGTINLNHELQSMLNVDSQKKISRFGRDYKVGDRVMQIKNNYDKFVFNGDIGKIKDIDNEDQKIFIDYGSRVLDYYFDELDELVLAYAISIHKSQGSEFDAVIIPIFMQHFILLQRNLIYTAITRAKKLCVLVGQTKAIAIGIKKAESVKRITFLKDFLNNQV